MLQVLPELRPDGERHVTEHRENLRLDGAVHVVVAEVGEENLHDLVREAADEPGAHGSADVAHQAHGSVTHLQLDVKKICCNNVTWLSLT